MFSEKVLDIIPNPVLYSNERSWFPGRSSFFPQAKEVDRTQAGLQTFEF
jgi:hypothetical protein